MRKYDLCVIGGGPSGYAAAMRAIDFEKNVLLIEQDRIGGAGIYNGALSSKTFWEISKEFASFNKKMVHLGLPQVEIHFRNVLQEVNEAIDERSKQLENHLRLVIKNHPELFNFLKGEARLLSKSVIEVKTNSGSENVYAENIIIASS